MADNIKKPAWAERLTAAFERSAFSSQQALANEVGRGQSQISEYMLGESEPDFSVLERLGKALKVSPAWLAFGEPDDGDALPSFVNPQENARLFAWCLHRVAGMLAEEGVDGDLEYLVRYTRKVMRATEGATDDAHAKNIISRTIESERDELRQGLEEYRKSRI